eukprot:10750936-Alexandrium_andersonii.AAC.1
MWSESGHPQTPPSCTALRSPPLSDGAPATWFPSSRKSCRFGRIPLEVGRSSARCSRTQLGFT